MSLESLVVTGSVMTRIPLLAALPATHALAGRAHLKLRELVDEEWLTCTPHLSTPPPGQVQALYQTFGLRPRIRAVAGTERAVVGRVAAGQGVTLVPRTLVNPSRRAWPSFRSKTESRSTWAS